MIYCTQCGNENDENSKFCRNCGAKLQAAAGQEQDNQAEETVSGQAQSPVYEKITDAEEQKPAPILSSEEIKINSYSGSDSQSYNNSNTGSNPYYDLQSHQYYNTGDNETKQGGGNIGFSIASLVCGILSLICCCLPLFSAVLAIAAVVIGIITLCFKYDGKGMAIAGIITGGIGFLIVIAMFVIGGTSAYNELINEMQYDFY